MKNLVLPESEAQPNRPIQGGGTNNGSALGWSSRAPGDLNGDGEPDYVAAAPYQDVGGVQDQGKVFFFLSNVPRSYPPPPDRGSPTPPGGRIRPNMLRPSVRARQRGNKISVRVSGRLTGVQGRPCGGRVKIGTRFAANRRLTRTTRMRSNCRYAESYSFPARRLPRRLRPRRRTLILRVAARFQGNARLTGDLSPTRKAKVRR